MTAFRLPDGGRIDRSQKLRFRFDWKLTLAMLAMVALGLVNLWSALQDRGPHLFSKQISLLALGLGVYFLYRSRCDLPLSRQSIRASAFPIFGA